MAPGLRNLRSSIDNPAGHAIVNEEEVPLVPIKSSEGRHSKHTRVSSLADDDGDADGWELDDFNSNTSRDNLHEAADYDLATASRQHHGRVRLGDEEKDAESKDEDEDPALAMVKAVVPETDDPSLPNLTFRVLVLGSILCMVGAAISQLFFVSCQCSEVTLAQGLISDSSPRRTVQVKVCYKVTYSFRQLS